MKRIPMHQVLTEQASALCFNTSPTSSRLASQPHSMGDPAPSETQSLGSADGKCAVASPSYVCEILNPQFTLLHFHFKVNICFQLVLTVRGMHHWEHLFLFLSLLD